MKKLKLNPEDPKIYQSDGSSVSIELKSINSNNRLLLSTVEVTQFSIEVAVQLGFAGILSGKADDKHSFYMFEYAASTPELTDDGKGNIVAYGYAMRIGIVVNTKSIKGEVNLSAIAAQATIEGAETLCSANFYSIDRTLISTLTGILPSNKSFDVGYISKIGSAITVIAESMAESTSGIGGATLLPLYAIDVPTENDMMYQSGLSSSYALHRLTKGMGYDGSIERKNEQIQKNNTKYLYPEINNTTAGVIFDKIMNGNRTADPNSDQKNKAKAIYDKCWPI